MNAPGLSALERWVDETARLTIPDRIVWCDGSDEESGRLNAEMTRNGVLLPLNSERFPGSYLHRSDPTDVARTEEVTFICTAERDDAGPTNNWMSVRDALAKIASVFPGVMKGQTMYVVPYVMGPVGSPYARAGVQITDSPYVVANLRIMTRMGKPAREMIARTGEFVRGVHAL